jgi:hypothetical protein
MRDHNMSHPNRNIPRPPDPPSPNEFNAQTVQGVYEEHMWPEGHQADNFASRTIMMTGTTSSAASNLISGVGRTRKSDDLMENILNTNKYTIGTISTASMLRGATGFDAASVMGATNFAVASFANPPVWEPGGTDEYYRQMYATVVQGSENAAWIGRRYTNASADGRVAGPVDVRNMGYKEDDLWAPVPANLGALVGTTGHVFIDNKLTEYLTPLAATAPFYSGFIDFVAGVRANIIANVEDSWVNINQVVAYDANLLFMDMWERDPNSKTCGDERCGSTIRQYTGVRINPIVDTDPECQVQIDVRVGVAVADLADSDGMLASNLHPLLATDDLAVEPKLATNNASIVADGRVVLGDGRSNLAQTGFSTDVTHIRDVLRLEARTEPPVFTEDVPAADRVGLIYFDAARGSLRVSVPYGSPSTGDWKDAAVAWVDIALATDAIDPARDVVGARGAALEADNAGLHAGLESGRQAFARREGAFIRPTAEVIAPEDWSSPEAQSVTMILAGFEPSQTRVYWRLRATDPRGVTGTSWALATNLVLGEVSGVGETALATLPFQNFVSGRTIPHRGQVVELMAVDARTGQGAGGAFSLVGLPRGYKGVAE